MGKLSTMLNQALNYRANKKNAQALDQVSHKLKKALLQKRAKQAVLKKEIETYMRSYLKPDAFSAYIPKDKKNDTEMRSVLLTKFSRKMELLDVHLLEDLTIEFR